MTHLETIFAQPHHFEIYVNLKKQRFVKPLKTKRTSTLVEAIKVATESKRAVGVMVVSDVFGMGISVGSTSLDGTWQASSN